MKSKYESMISIIIPVYNAEKFLGDTIKTIQDQTYQNWEAIFVDDKSSDDSVKRIKNAAKKDKRIRVISKSKNEGTALTRNCGINAANGRYICFLDADDLWNKDKLQKQITLMRIKNCGFSYTGYVFADKDGTPNGPKVHVPSTLTYKRALKNTTIFVSTVMIDMWQLAKKDIQMPNVKSEDTATWWKILKKTKYAYGLNEILVIYRRSANTKSSNKVKAIKQTWELYRKVEKFSIIRSMYYFCFYAINAVMRRI